MLNRQSEDMVDTNESNGEKVQDQTLVQESAKIDTVDKVEDRLKENVSHEVRIDIFKRYFMLKLDSF